ncbi:MAG: lactoylglutathione lyase [Bacteroidetes bacterium RIFOXYA12_FULL_35_11]|nr:MAG: lactoylglutathione lyase [Bacteroidetes bacterium GWF2_35_48]OFY72715.1 MAG: lactoylglutathione lyase [Bacteroidetes bacterium RIFOXYA12_FULL_35_11]OFY95773.1 MAG: lactoylglutathione lyase [Bacteroidetes bacterium RIFOXYC12_FULL_35_7]HBX53583.1 lactoylglutathione lyase [Bacteroidales bacterium]
MVEFILYIENQSLSRDFYSKLLQKEPVLDVPGMTEFLLAENCKLGLMPSSGIAKIIGKSMMHPTNGKGIPRCELYLFIGDVADCFNRAVTMGATPVSEPDRRDWGDIVAYVADPDGHIIAFAEKPSNH